MSHRASASKLGHAIEDYFLRQEFQLDYQPVLSLDKQRIGGFEALLHLRQDRVQYYPADFIPVVEATSLRAPLARWILREVCRQVLDWRHQGGTTPVSISVNVSPRQLFQGRTLINQLEHVLTETGMEPSGLHLEIPAAVSQQMQSLRHTLETLNRLGVRLYIDNFEPSPKALKILSEMPVDAVKLCHSALRNFETSTQTTQNLESILHRAEDLGVQVIAKRIETPIQLSALKSYGLRYGQGFLFAKPVTSHEAAALLAMSPAIAEFDLPNYIATMNKLSQYLRHFLGKVVVKYWRESKPSKTWLTGLIPLSTGDIVLAEQDTPTLIDLLQQQDLRQWVHNCLGQCRRVFPTLATMLNHAGLTPAEQQLLGFGKGL